VFQHACKMGLEGIVSKRLGSRYRSGRSPDWLKFKNPEAESMTSKERKKSSAQPVPQYTWQGFIAYAESFGQAAAYVSNGIHLMHEAPVGALACHCIELSLKAVLLKQGYMAEREVVYCDARNARRVVGVGPPAGSAVNDGRSESPIAL
jgi:hypothetical protein